MRYRCQLRSSSFNEGESYERFNRISDIGRRLTDYAAATGAESVLMAVYDSVNGSYKTIDYGAQRHLVRVYANTHPYDDIEADPFTRYHDLISDLADFTEVMLDTPLDDGDADTAIRRLSDPDRGEEMWEHCRSEGCANQMATMLKVMRRRDRRRNASLARMAHELKRVMQDVEVETRYNEQPDGYENPEVAMSHILAAETPAELARALVSAHRNME